MRKSLRILAVGVSSALFVCLAVLTIRSLGMGMCETVTRSMSWGYAYAESVDGKILLNWSVYSSKWAGRGKWKFESIRARNYRPSDSPWFNVGGLAFFHVSRSAKRPASRTYLMIPGWLSLPATAVIPIWWASGIRRRRRMNRGCCVVCGYDLRESPEGCPECGKGREAQQI